MKALRRQLTYANVMATLAVFIALGGSGYAAVKINGKQIKNRSVAGKKLKKNTVGGAEVKESRVGKVPAASRADRAGRADEAGLAVSAGNSGALGGVPASGYLRSNALANPAWQNLVLQNGWQRGVTGAVPAVYRDRSGVVHLKGAVQRSSGAGSTVATLPPAYRPESIRTFVTICLFGLGTVDVRPSGAIDLIPKSGADCDTVSSLDPVSFRPDE